MRKILYILLIIYLLLGTGIFSDDFDTTKEALAGFSWDGWQRIPVLYTHYFWFAFGITGLGKILYTILAFFMISQFFGIYLSRENAMITSFIFLFFPSHDATVYWFTGYYYTLSVAFYLYAFYLAYNNRRWLAFLFATLGSFICYGSPVLAFGLSLLLILEHRKSFPLLIPNIIYIAYYFIVVKFFGATDKCAEMTLVELGKSIIVQFGSGVDALMGISLWLKIFYAVPTITFILALPLIITKREKYNWKLLLSLFIIMILSFFMFALTGRYPQLAFNIGDKVTIFGSLFVAYIVANSRFRIVFLILLIFAIFGISEHWKDWTVEQNRVITNIERNPALKDLNEKIYVAGHHFSQYGPISHIEFMSEAFVATPVFQLALDRWVSARPISGRFVYKDGYLIDEKGTVPPAKTDNILVYDTDTDKVFRITDISGYLATLPIYKRHWLQLIEVK